MSFLATRTRAHVDDGIEVEVGKTYTHKPTGKQVTVVAKAHTLDAEKWHVEQVGDDGEAKRMFPVLASALAPVA